MGYRRIHIEKEVWEYIVGGGVKIRSPKGKVIWVKNYILLGKTFEEYKTDLHRAYEEHDMDRGIGYKITPSNIKMYIENYLIKQEIA